MVNWFQHAQIAKIQKRIPANHRKGLCLPIERVLLDGADPINLKDKATALLFHMVGFDAYDRWAGLQEFSDDFALWMRRHDQGPSLYAAPEMAEIFELRNSSDGWKQIDGLFDYLAGTSLSKIVDTTQVLHHADDPGLHGPELFSIDIKVTAYDLVNGFSNAPWVAMASSLDLILSLAEKALEAQADVFSQMSHFDQALGDSSYHLKVLRAKPAQISIIHNGKRVIEIPVERGRGDQLFDINWSQTRFLRCDRDTITAVAAVAPASVGNAMKGKCLEEEMGL
jgi:hypothetical protein